MLKIRFLCKKSSSLNISITVTNVIFRHGQHIRIYIFREIYMEKEFRVQIPSQSKTKLVQNK